VRLRPTNPLQVQRALLTTGSEPQIELSEGLADNVVLGDNLVVPYSSSADESFWIMLCDKPLHVVRVGFTDAWGQEWFAGDHAIRGLWYERTTSGSRTYELLDGGAHAYVYSNLVVASKFAMLPCQLSQHWIEYFPTMFQILL
jgi:hypothetical protein